MSLDIGQVVRHDGKLYQILKIGPNLITAHSYGKTCGVESTILVSRATGNIVALKSEVKRTQKCNLGKQGV